MTIGLLEHFPKSLMLMEKPSHNSAAEANEFIQRLTEHKLANRVVIGFHDSLHPTRKKLLELVKENKCKIKHVSIKFNYPKDPTDKMNDRIYQKPFGGTMLDLGVYVYRASIDIAKALGYKLSDFDTCKSNILYNSYGVDIKS
eukprot:CAMPEP_0176340056 /NCGR_PEP_ID=MMETSP0126-20121128/1262_1 /TAXON_ID=141414 ORGANISM="Strombidinopsis acuminatum, Strain SPMC142" /NCGR_SAMPLE_ID=MMETSP0126 /ASSEMBLY_ACC=CAM_ASM_000229 /LENGTH=142 /DNA_ID=CAMNT_0017684023 /DNA_START=294 /DNA_END=722 /DNA_ORIENTATION=+